ncbi:Radical SAM superfamily enzyme, MoaA/NifB/PqqE/SkfB family [Treponema bryantii]|uniref:Radical SAM superfamily enzyme, MoaA/NifB/PqqE/SkfB family n=1 Tax=Treponema bryantii TaxID=163 RepID=A0A1H9FUE0_9SPIR|nr:radical SAM protein [Treponema bryantii]SEQ41476.1 Radical SAM superfamily enzyme, MoaA/NifB/PqqE/SkfB family [Treponema bryantii]
MSHNISERKSVNDDCCYRRLENNKRRVIWEITSKCNLACKHCFVNTNTGKDVDTDSCIRVINLFSEMNDIGKIMITGGEPFLREDIFTILEHIRKKMPDAVIDLTTNMTMLDSDKIKKLRKLQIDELTVSLDGIGNIHDEIRGKKGCFDKTVENIKSALNEGLYIDIVSVISAYNVNSMDVIADFVSKLKCSSLTFSKIIERSEKKIEDKVLIQYNKEFELKVAELRKKYNGILPIRIVGEKHTGQKICCKKDIISISAEGWIERCLLSNDRLLKNNIKDENLTSEMFNFTNEIRCF